MCKQVLCLLFALLLPCLVYSQVVYVDYTATGSNDGSSWENAYTDLQLALTAEATEVWIAKGIYIPDGDSATTKSHYLIGSSAVIYGGFEGSETMIDQRDLSANVTILSGDIAQDDVDSDFMNHKADNVEHVVMIGQISENVTLDGITIEGGHAPTDSIGPSQNSSGGGIYAQGPLTLINCNLRNNSAARGGGLAMIGNSGLTVEITNTSFVQNRSTESGAGLYADDIDDVSILNSSFRNNTCTKGAVFVSQSLSLQVDTTSFIANINPNPNGYTAALYSKQNSTTWMRDCQITNNTAANAAGVYIDSQTQAGESPVVRLTNCTFEKNTSEAKAYGAGLYLWQGTDIQISDCTFSENNAGNGAGIYYNGQAESSKEPLNCQLTGCMFTNNRSEDFGGAGLYADGGSYQMLDCGFNSNIATKGAHIVNRDSNRVYNVVNSNFILGIATEAAAIVDYGANSNGRYYNCNFILNEAEERAGVFSLGQGTSSILDSCQFSSNSAGLTAGAIHGLSDAKSVRIRKCIFASNSSVTSGGAIQAAGNTLIEKSIFFSNKSETGGAVSLGLDTTSTTGNYQIKECAFANNEASAFGGAIHLMDLSGSISNSLFYGNQNNDATKGNAIHFLGLTTESSLHIINNTLYQNTGQSDVSVGVETEDSAAMSLTFQNNIFDEVQALYSQGQDITLQSLGGNLSLQGSIPSDLLTGTDLEDGDPKYINVDSKDFRLDFGSICIDKGVNQGAPTTDLAGFTRGMNIDIGAYEYNPAVDTDVLSFQHFEIAPNPASSAITVTTDLKGVATLVATTIDGKKVHKCTVAASDVIDVSSWPAGSYQLFLIDKEIRISRLIKL